MPSIGDMLVCGVSGKTAKAAWILRHKQFSIASIHNSIYSKIDMSALLDQALKLPVSERIRLADDIYDSLNGSPGSVRLTDAQVTELERRLEDHQKHPEDAIPWEEVRDRLRHRA